MAEQIGAGVSEYRGVVMPLGMTPACVDELASLFSDFEWDRLKRADGELAFTADAAVIAFEIVSRNLAIGLAIRRKQLEEIFNVSVK